MQGTVTDGTGEPLIGVSVVVKNAKGLGVVTDIDGNYKINVNDKNAVLVFSHRLHSAGKWLLADALHSTW